MPKDPNAPRRYMSSYLFFACHNRESVKARRVLPRAPPRRAPPSAALHSAPRFVLRLSPAGVAPARLRTRPSR